MDKSKNSSLPGVLAVILIVASFLLSWLWIVPKYRQNLADVKQVDAQDQAAIRKLDSLKSSEKTISALGSTVDSLFIAIPGDQDSGNIITSLESIASLTQTYIPSFQITDGTNSNVSTSAGTVLPGKPVLVAFSVSGDFAGLSKFITAVETDLKFFSVKSLSLSQTTTDGSNTMVMMLKLEANSRASATSTSATN